MFVVFNVISDTNSCVPSNQDTFDKGLMWICRHRFLFNRWFFCNKYMYENK